jgi:hypothetical protein
VTKKAPAPPERPGTVATTCLGGSDMTEATQPDLTRRLAELEEHVRRVLLVVGAAGAMLAEIRRDEEDEQ